MSNVVELTPLEVLQVRAVSAPSDAKFILFAAHRPQDQVTLSYNATRSSKRPKGSYVRGKDVGLVVQLEDQNVTDASVWLTEDSNERSKVLVSISWHLSAGKLCMRLRDGA